MKTAQVLRAAAAVACVALATAGCGSAGSGSRSGSVPQRIISLAPSITETLFALGCGERVVGVSSYCSYPPQVRQLPKVGAYLDPNLEAMLKLAPDLVVMMREESKVGQALEANGVRTLSIDNHDIAAILGSFRAIGAACGVAGAAEGLIADISTQLRDSASVQGARPRVLMCVGRSEPGSGSVRQAFLAGPATFYQDILTAAGGRNVVEDSLVAYPAWSGEGILRAAPDIIIDLLSDTAAVPTQRIRADWSQFAGLPAVRDRMVHCLAGEYVTTPGPRLVMVLHDFKRIVAAWRATRKG